MAVVSIRTKHGTDYAELDIPAAPAGPIQPVGLAPTASPAANVGALQAAHDRLPASGGVLGLEGGLFNLAGTIAITKPVTYLGIGTGDSGGNVPGTILRQLTPGIPTFSLAVDEACGFKDFTIVNGTGGTGIQIDGASATTQNLRTTIENVQVVLGAYGVVFHRGALTTIRKCYFNSYGTAGVVVRNIATVVQDFGGVNIDDTIFATGIGQPGAGVVFLGGGGFFWHHSGVTGGANGILVSPEAGVNTTELIFDGGFIANCPIGIYYAPGGGGFVGSSLIRGIDFQNNASQSILLDAPNAYHFNIVGNILAAGNPAGNTYVLANWGADCYIGDNTMRGNGGVPVAIQIGAGFVRATIGVNHYNAFAQTILNASPTTELKGVPSLTAAQLPAVCANGSIVWCPDGTMTTPVAGGGGGTLAVRRAGVWAGL